MNLMPKNAKNANSYECKFCDFICSKKSNWNIHLSTRKHNIRTTLNEIEPNHAKKCPNLFTCDCGKGYPARNSLWYHKKKCSFVQKDTEEDTKEDNISLAEKMVEMVMSKNQEFMSEFMGKMMELMPKVGNNTNTNCLNTNNQFNINMFLNEHCKDAMNIKDFIKSLPITTQMYDDINKNGTAETLTKTMIEGLNKMEVVERPIHCMDQKRKVMYVKDDDKWEKDINNEKVTNSAASLLASARKDFTLWIQHNQDYTTNDNKQNSYMDIVNKILHPDLTEIPNNTLFLKGLAENTYLDKEFKHMIANSTHANLLTTITA
jgi:hypothetical protein